MSTSGLEGVVAATTSLSEVDGEGGAVSRVSGWIAHALEQRRANRIIRPQSACAGPRDRRWTPLADRAGG